MNDKSALFRAEPEEKLQQAALRYLGGEMTCAQLLSGGLFNTTYRLETASRKAILRLGPVNRHLLLPYERHLMAAEGDILRLLKKHSIPTSEILALDLSRSLFDRDVMAVSCLDARSLSMLEPDRDTERRLCREAGALTAKIHAITSAELENPPEKPFGRYSNVISGNGCATWKEAILLELAQWRASAEKAGLFDGEELRKIETVFSTYSYLLDEVTQPRLVHADLWYGNILVDAQWNLTAIIDADRAFFGDVEYEFATGWMISDSFLEGCAEPLDEAPGSVMRRRLYKLLLNLEDCYILFCEYSDPKAAEELKQRILEEIAELGKA